PAHTGLTPRARAEGGGDNFLVGLNRLLAEHGEVTFLRPLSEMNNGNNSYAPYNLDGSSRGAAKSGGQFLWGGERADITRTGRRLGMPPVRTRASSLPPTLVALMWVPLSFGNPEIPKNH